MAARTLEDFVVGETWKSPVVTVSEADIIGFASVYDPQPMHTDTAAAAEGRFGGIIASGWHIAGLAMRLFIQSGGYGETPVVGMGIDELRWRVPVRPGDSLRVERELIEARRSRSNPGYGILRTRVRVFNQRDEVVMSLITNGQVPARTAGDDEAPAA